MASKPKFEEELREDRISQMPDDVLLRILPLLDSTILAARTTVLSKRWNNLWLFISSLGFNYLNFNPDRFPTLVEHVVSLHGSTDIQKFSLSYKVQTGDETLADGYARIRRCICTLVERNVVELELELAIDFNDYAGDGIDSPFLFPESLLMSKTLTVLKVDPSLISFSNCPSKGCFPNLKVLSIGCIGIECPWDDSFKELLTCCPMLEDLSLYGLEGISDVNISSPQLKTLRIYLEADTDNPRFFISAPKLENFDVDDYLFLSNYLFENGKSLINAKIRVCGDVSRDGIEDQATALFAKMSNVEYLSLDVYGLNPSCLPEFVNLSRSVLVLQSCDYWEYLIGFLKKCPNLKHLVLEHESNEWYYEEDELDWNFSNPTELPACLVSHLQTVSIEGFKGQRDEMEVAEYLLRNGKVLNTMSIKTEKLKGQFLYTKEELYKKLLKYDMGSESCRIKLNFFD